MHLWMMRASTLELRLLGVGREIVLMRRGEEGARAVEIGTRSVVAIVSFVLFLWWVACIMHCGYLPLLRL